MERTFLDVLNDGIRVENGFKKETWMAAESAVKVLCPSLTHDQAKNKHDSCKLKWKAWLDLSQQPDFGWNEVTQLYQASDEVWNLFIAVNLFIYDDSKTSADPGKSSHILTRKAFDLFHFQTETFWRIFSIRIELLEALLEEPVIRVSMIPSLISTMACKSHQESSPNKVASAPPLRIFLSQVLMLNDDIPRLMQSPQV